ncbi:MAG: hypothetical protein ACLFNQ_12025 [Spirochaetaceae bacterium]
MTLFALLSAFLTFVFVLSCLGGRAISSSVVFGPFARGAVSFFPAYLFIAWFEWGVAKQFMPGALYVWHATGAFLIPFATLAVLGAFFLRPVFHEQPTEVFVALAAFGSGFATAWALADLVFGSQYPGHYTLFLEPLLRISAILFIPAVVTSAKATFGIVRILYILLAPVWLFLLPFVPMLHYLGFFGWAIAAAVVFLAAASGITYVLQGNYFRSYR